MTEMSRIAVSHGELIARNDTLKTSTYVPLFL